MSKVEEVVDLIAKYLEEGQWSRADRMQLVLNELVKLEVAALDIKNIRTKE